jgi:hypothetical protein
MIYRRSWRPDGRRATESSGSTIERPRVGRVHTLLWPHTPTMAALGDGLTSGAWHFYGPTPATMAVPGEGGQAGGSMRTCLSPSPSWRYQPPGKGARQGSRICVIRCVPDPQPPGVDGRHGGKHMLLHPCRTCRFSRWGWGGGPRVRFESRAGEWWSGGVCTCARVPLRLLPLWQVAWVHPPSPPGWAAVHVRCPRRSGRRWQCNRRGSYLFALYV